MRQKLYRIYNATGQLVANKLIEGRQKPSKVLLEWCNYHDKDINDHSIVAAG